MSAFERAYAILWEQIADGHLAPGTRLLEEDLALETGVSRTPIREALRQLASDGLVEYRPGKGAYVLRQTPEEVAEIFGLRSLVEGYGARLAAGKISDHELDQLRKLAERMETAAPDPQRRLEVAELNYEFHHLVLQAGDNAYLTRVFRGLVRLPLVNRMLCSYSHEELRRSMDHHRELIRALEAGAAQWAETIMRAHILAGQQRIVHAEPGGEQHDDER